MNTRLDKCTGFLVKLLGASVWISSLLFGLYILGFYALALVEGNPERWNGKLAGLFVADRELANIGIGLHFLGGGLLLVLGNLQFIQALRERMPHFHRIAGRLYVASAMLASLGGLAFIGINGTIGGTPMDVAFTLYGVLMFIAAFQTTAFALKRKIPLHRR